MGKSLMARFYKKNSSRPRLLAKLPNSDDLYIPIFNYFSDKKTHNIDALFEYLVNYFELDLDDNALNINRIFYRIIFGVVYDFFKVDFLERKEQGKYIISKKGLDFYNTNSDKMNPQLIKSYIKDYMEKIKDKTVINLDIHNVGTIFKANIEISRINIVCGQNSTGKSTASKLLYCFLKYNSPNRQEYAYESLINQISMLFSKINRLTIRSNDWKLADYMRSDYNKLNSSDISVWDKLELYENLKVFIDKNSDSLNLTNMDLNYIYEDFEEIEYLIDIIQEDGSDFYKYIMKNLLDSEFSNEMSGYSEFSGFLNGYKFIFSSKFDKNYKFDSFGQFMINNVFYIDSFSCLDINQSKGLINTDHVKSLLKSIDNRSNKYSEMFDDIKNKKIIKLENEINDLISGDFDYDNGELKFFNERGIHSNMINTASGIKQIGIIQLLLTNRELKENSFIIIDEPEVNLHPEWQFKLAEIICKLAMDLDIYFYINTHSPMFIEAIQVLTKYYQLQEQTTFYLTEKNDKNTFEFVKYDYDDLYEIYDNLAKPFDAIEVYRLKAEYKKDND